MTKKILSLMAAVGFLLGSVTAMAVPKNKAGYLAEAQKYEKMAADEQAIVKEHKEMKQDYRSHQANLPKQTREQSLSEMDDHCDAIISSAQKLADEYTALAQWHRHLAEESRK